MIRLFAENPGQANPNLALRWCVDKKTLDELKDRGLRNPQLLLVIAQHPRPYMVKEIERKLVPLDQVMEWLEFNRPGRYTIYATIVWDANDKTNFDAQWLLLREDGKFRKEIFDCNGNFSRTFYTQIDIHSLDEGSLDVVVEKEFFAKEPPPWLNWWVNLWFEAMEIFKPTNQCSFRRRAILAFTIQPIPAFVWVLLKSLMRLFAALAFVPFGMRRISFKPIIHPFDLCLENVWSDIGPSVFLKDKHGNWHFSFITGPIGRGLRTIWRVLTPPPSSEKFERRKEQKELKLARTNSRLLAKQTRKQREKQEREQRELMAFYEELQDVACIGVPLKPKFELLPERRRTFHLRYMDLKAKVCKPFAR